MKKIVYLLSIGLMVILVGCGNTTIKDPPMASATEIAEQVTPEVIAPQPIVKKEWVVTDTWSGNDSKKIESFIVNTKDTRITWDITGSVGNQGTFSFFIKDNEESPYISILTLPTDAVLKGTIRLNSIEEVGRYSLYVNSENCKWTIIVEQQK